MLDKTSRKFMKLITTNAPNMRDGHFTFDYVGGKLGLDKQKSFACIRFLEHEGLIECLYIEMPNSNGKKSLWGFNASHKGYHYEEFMWLEFWGTMLKSVLFPIVVSIVTSLLISA